MGLFSSSNSHLDEVRKECQSVSQRAAAARQHCDASLRGKHELMDPEDRARLLEKARAEVREGAKILESARRREKQMTEDNCPSEDILTAHARVLEATLDMQRAEQAIKDGRDSLAQAIPEIESFFGAGSREARQIRKTLADLDAG